MAKPKSLRMSVTQAASHTRVPAGGVIMAPASAVNTRCSGSISTSRPTLITTLLASRMSICDSAVAGAAAATARV
jgi:hypothetical protein